ncbi:Histidine kinase [Kitasatospora sp. MMS16-BH015]|uniref:sensor histidine kinase n=1 Tax=Kitasatospora sp. MMS16-BH015 TaxID=2018025 RepID=UPI000CA1AEC9|nr:histidine kinase [Kitasatospora sp. MMS16-BH015]AUG78337.1 Histidine kinase [Kitasatospora sp. MMS16-BH015]
MSATPSPAPLRRVPPAGWTALAWCLSTLYSFLVQIRWPGEGLRPWGQKSDQIAPFSMMPREWAMLLFAMALAAAGCVLLALVKAAPATVRAAPAAEAVPAAEAPPAKGAALGSVAALTASALVLTNGPFHTTSVAPEQYLPVCVALGTVAAAVPRRVSLGAVGVSLLGLFGYLGVRVALGLRVGTSVEAVVLMMVAVAWVLGDARRQEHRHARELRDRAAEQAVTAERLRIARELHDMVAHSIGVVAFQSGAAKRVIETQPEAARRALGAIESTSRETLAGLRRMLGALHAAEPAAPPAGLAELAGLVANVGEAGVRVDVQWHGERRPLPPEVDLAAFRLIQESVTNVVKHSAARQCRVTVEYAADGLSVVIVNSGAGHGKGSGTGYGVAGMRDRVELLHGEFAAGPRPEGGYRVAARLPLPTEV